MKADIATAIEQMRLGKPEMSEEALEALAEAAIELPTTALGKLVGLLREIQKENVVATWGPMGAGAMPLTERQLSINDKLSQARLLLDVIIGDGE